MSSLHDWVRAHSPQMDTLSLGALGATILGYLPQIGALLSVVWFSLKIAIALQEWTLNRRKLRGD